VQRPALELLNALLDSSDAAPESLRQVYTLSLELQIEHDSDWGCSVALLNSSDALPQSLVQSWVGGQQRHRAARAHKLCKGAC
jgi:hypothetical protein